MLLSGTILSVVVFVRHMSCMVMLRIKEVLDPELHLSSFIAVVSSILLQAAVAAQSNIVHELKEKTPAPIIQVSIDDISMFPSLTIFSFFFFLVPFFLAKLQITPSNFDLFYCCSFNFLICPLSYVYFQCSPYVHLHPNYIKPHMFPIAKLLRLLGV